MVSEIFRKKNCQVVLWTKNDNNNIWTYFLKKFINMHKIFVMLFGNKEGEKQQKPSYKKSNQVSTNLTIIKKKTAKLTIFFF